MSTNDTGAHVVTNLDESDVTLADLLGGAAASLDHLNLYRHDHAGQRQFKIADGRWFVIAYGAWLTQLDRPACDTCAADLAPEDIGTDAVLCKTCLASRR